LEQAAINVGFDLWRAVAVSYASAYAGLDELFGHLFDDGPPPADRDISPPSRNGVLDRAGLGLP
jgi:hypothetical protein